MNISFRNSRGEDFPHTGDSWAETLEIARMYGFEKPDVLRAPRPGQRVPDEEARAMADALYRAVAEELGEHSVMKDFADLLSGGGVHVVEEQEVQAP